MRAIKPVAFLLCLVPAAALVERTLTGTLGANPAETLQLQTGLWALRLLLVTLAITPIRRLTGWNRIVQYRRMLGLFAFFYATLHVLTYVVLDQLFAFDQMLKDVAKRPFITFGAVAFAAMIPLAITSTKGWIRRLGRKWQALHRLIYVSGAAAAVHFIWKVKVAVGEPVYYGAILAVLLCVRLWLRARKQRATARATATA